MTAISACWTCDETLCAGCAFECRGCQNSFCLADIAITELPNGYAFYDCRACLAAAVRQRCGQALELLAGVR